MAYDNALVVRTMKRITDLRMELVSEHPFFGRLLLHLTPGLADCGTACTDMKHLIFDPAFAEKLTDPEMKFVMLHEMLHCVLKHCVRGRALNRFLYNVACDIVVNSLILEAMGVASFVVDGEEPMHLVPNGQEGRIYTAEEVYYMLLQQAKTALPPAGTGNQAYGTPGGWEDSNMTGVGQSGHESTMDSHEIWNDISEADAGVLSDQWEQRIRSASITCGVGSDIPRGIRRYLAETTHMARTNWRQVLANFIRHDRADFTFTQRDKRYTGEIILPSFVENMYGDAVDRLWFCVDVSGSVNDRMLSVVFAEIVAACNQIDALSGQLAFFDTTLSAFYSFENEEELGRIEPVGGGGTSFQCIFDRLDEVDEEERPVGIVVLTDGYASIPAEESAQGIPVLWIIINSSAKPGWGTVIYIEE